jgi:kynurenine formamidase
MSRTGDDWLSAIAGARVYDLGRELSPETPHHPNHAPLMHRLTKAHGDAVDPHGMSAANDIITMGTHVGTHIDGLGHIAVDGCVTGGIEASTVHNRWAGFVPEFGIGAVPPIVKPAVVADIPGLLGVETLADDHAVTAEQLASALERQGARIVEGGALLVRTGWGRDWPHVHLRHDCSPGPDEDAVRWAWDAGARLFGSDTIVFEHVPAPGLPVHRLLIFERGAHIIEAMDLEEVCGDGVWEFLLVLAPLKLRGGTGSPLRPVALAPPQGLPT